MSASPKPEEFKFYVNPRESIEERELRWDKWMQELATDGLTIQGTGPDGDDPIRHAFSADGHMTFDEWWTGNPDKPFFEVYNIIPLGQLAAEEDARPADCCRAVAPLDEEEDVA